MLKDGIIEPVKNVFLLLKLNILTQLKLFLKNKNVRNCESEIFLKSLPFSFFGRRFLFKLPQTSSLDFPL